MLDASNRDQIGNHLVIVEIESNLPRLMDKPTSYSPKRYIRIEIEILDCKVNSFEPGIQEFVSMQVEIGEEIVFPFKNYIMTPDCQFDVNYTLTLLEKDTSRSVV